MRILYGVQATGNGHITRARTMARQLQQSNLHVDYLFSGRAAEKFFNMEPFGNYRCYRGFTLVASKGRIQNLKTLLNNNILQFIQDVRTLDLSQYDLILTDFEPVTAWAAKLRNKPSIGVGHQYAFFYDIPKAEHNSLVRLIMRYFAPAKKYLGVHWHHFEYPILPPLIESPKYDITYLPKKILVYLPFDDTEEVIEWLKPLTTHEFHIYCEYKQPETIGKLHLHPYSRKNFQKDLASCSGVIANAGFGLSSEAIQYGKKILVKPLKGQMEQLSNAKTLAHLHLGDVIHDFDSRSLKQWLDKPNPQPIKYPNVAGTIIDWIQNGESQNTLQLAKELWQQVNQGAVIPN